MKRNTWDVRLLEWMQRSPAHERTRTSRPALAVAGAIWGIAVVVALSGEWTLAWALGVAAVIVSIAARTR